MKPNKYINILASVFTILCFSGCIDEKLTDYGDLDQEANSFNGDTYYMAMRVYNAAAIDAGTRADDFGPVYDSDGADENGSDDKKFNVGLISENAIYTGYTKKEDCPNLMLVFEKKTNSDFSDYDNTRLEYLLPLYDFEYENKDGNLTPAEGSQTVTSTYNEYFTFYTSASKYLLPENFEDRMVLLVLNASPVLKSQLEDDLLNRKKYSDILETKLNQDKTVLRDRDFIYLTLPSGEQYLTMSSSMVVPKVDVVSESFTTLTPTGKYGPSVYKRDFDWQPTKEEAAKYPIFSFFLERAQSKFTLTIKQNDEYCYFSNSSQSTSDSEKQAAEPTEVKYTDIGINLMISPSLDKTIYYVNEYIQRDDEITYDDDYVKQFIETASANDIKINFTGWDINGIERSEFLFKKINPDIGNYFNYLTNVTWNPDAYSPYRNFWAEDVNYNAGTAHPDQFNEAKKLVFRKKDNKGNLLTNIKDGEIITDESVKSFDDIKDDLTRLDYYPFMELVNHDTHKYAPENTYDVNKIWKTPEDLKKAYDGRAYMRTGSHIILTSQLLIREMEYPTLFDDPWINAQGWARNKANHEQAVASKFYMNGIFWSETAYLNYASEYLGYWMQQDTITFGPNDGIFYVSPTADRTNAQRATYNNFQIENLKLEGTDGWVHVIPKRNMAASLGVKDPEVTRADDENNEGQEGDEGPKSPDDEVVLYAYDTNKNEYKEITRATFENLVLSHPEYFAQHFYRGQMYYAIPITHKDTGSTTLYTGKHGAVRNHWYNYTITDVKNIGTPVSDPEQDLIIPNVDHSYESLGLTLSVLPWHVIDENVDISGQRPPLTPDEIYLDLKIRANDWEYEGKNEEL